MHHSRWQEKKALVHRQWCHEKKVSAPSVVTWSRLRYAVVPMVVPVVSMVAPVVCLVDVLVNGCHQNFFSLDDCQR
jgi:hypothetical protein